LPSTKCLFQNSKIVPKIDKVLENTQNFDYDCAQTYIELKRNFPLVHEKFSTVCGDGWSNVNEPLCQRFSNSFSKYKNNSDELPKHLTKNINEDYKKI
jgi:hypothetical protein